MMCMMNTIPMNVAHAISIHHVVTAKTEERIMKTKQLILIPTGDNAAYMELANKLEDAQPGAFVPLTAHEFSLLKQIQYIEVPDE